MRLTVDLAACQSEDFAFRGIGRYSLALLKNMMAQKPDEDTIKILLSANYPEHDQRLRQELNAHDFDYYSYSVSDKVMPRDSDWRRIVAGELILDKYKNLNTDVLYISSIFMGLGGKSAVPVTFPEDNKFVASTVYDLIPLIFKNVYLTGADTQNWYFDCIKKLKECDLLLSISESTRQDMIRFLDMEPDKIVNISAAVNTKLFRMLEKTKTLRDAIRARYNITKPFVMYTGGIDWRKNIEGLTRAYAKLSPEIRENHQLVIVCSASVEATRNIMKVAHEAGLSDADVIFTGFVPDDDLVALYNLCKLFVFPSFYEGFGLPVLEAMSCGAPVVGGNNSSIAEIIKRKDALFDADNIDDVASCMYRVLCDKDMHDELSRYSMRRAKDFSWEETAKTAYNAIKAKYEEWRRLKSRTPKKIGTHHRRIAMVTPLPPQKTGIADYTSELLHVLYKVMDVDIYTDCNNCSDDTINSHYTIHRYTELPSAADSYDAIIYQIGNSDFHTYMYDLLMRCPGIVVSHDFFLDGLMSCVSRQKGLENIYFDDMLYSHGVKGSYLIRDVGAGPSPLPINKRILDMSTGVIFHSIYAKKLYEKFYNHAEDLNYIISHLARSVSDYLPADERKKIRRSLGIGEDVFVVASFGIVAHTKMPLSVLRGYLEFSRKTTHMRTVIIFVGIAVDNEFKEELDDVVASRDDVKLTGYVDRADYTKYLNIADVAVQLRQKSRGESSGTALDALAHGLPLVVNDYATFEEFPDDVVLKIPAKPSYDDVSEALLRLANDEDLRKKAGCRGYEYIKKYHNPNAVADEYLNFVNKTIARESGRNREEFIRRLNKRIEKFSLGLSEIKEISPELFNEAHS